MEQTATTTDAGHNQLRVRNQPEAFVQNSNTDDTKSFSQRPRAAWPGFRQTARSHYPGAAAEVVTQVNHTNTIRGKPKNN